jgi:glycine/D-amino acid oxidase-like deaminating enzyme
MEIFSAQRNHLTTPTDNHTIPMQQVLPDRPSDLPPLLLSHTFIIKPQRHRNVSLILSLFFSLLPLYLFPLPTKNTMDKRSAIAVLPPQPNPTTSYWQDPPDPILADFQSTSTLPQFVHTVIVGSGITGASVAHNLLSSGFSSSTVILEARQTCSGATGRNGGHTKAASYRSFLTHVKNHGIATAVKIARFEYDTILSLQAFARENSIECDMYSGDTVDVFYDAASWETAQKSVGEMRAAMPEDLESTAKYTFWSVEEARERFHVKGEGCCGAVSYFAGSLSAYAFVCGVMKLCLEKGLQLYTHTPVLSLSKAEEDGLWYVKTERGTVRATNVVLATNGYTAAIAPAFQGRIVPLRGHITVQRPGVSLPPLPATYSFIYPSGYEYMIPKAQNSKFGYPGDIIIGGGLTKTKAMGEEEFGTVDDGSINGDISMYLTGCTETFFGDSWGKDQKEGRVRRAWTGIMGFSGDGMPFVGGVPGEGNRGLWIAAGFQGHGMVLCWRCGEALVGMMAGEEREWFPEVFKITEDRLLIPFTGLVH